MRWLLMLLGGFCMGASLFILFTEPWREVLGLVIAGTAIGVGCLMVLLAEGREA